MEEYVGQDSSNLDLMLGYRTTQGAVWGELNSNMVCKVATEISNLASNLKSIQPIDNKGEMKQ
jgi:hypothetical protein